MLAIENFNKETLAAGISDFGNKVVCVDILKDKIQSLKNGNIPIYEPGLDDLVERNVKANRLYFSTNISEAIQKSDIVFIAVGTPQAKDGHADLSAVKVFEKTSSIIGPSQLWRFLKVRTASTDPGSESLEVKSTIFTLL